MSQPPKTNPKAKIQVQNISCILPHTKQLGGLFLGNFYGAQNQAILLQYGIRAVVSLSPEVYIAIKYNILKIPFFKKVKAHDKDDYQIISDLDQCINFIHKHRRITNVYVHCYAGVSRSATIVIAYLMKMYKMNLETALAYVKMRRIVAKPNDGFMKQLRIYEKKLRQEANIFQKQNIQSQQLNMKNHTKNIKVL